MSINFSTIEKKICQSVYQRFFHIFYLCSLQYFIYRSIMSDFFSGTKPMDIEGKAACAVGPQLVTVEGEKGVGVDVKRTSSHLEADNLLAWDKGEPTDDQ